MFERLKKIGSLFHKHAGKKVETPAGPEPEPLKSIARDIFITRVSGLDEIVISDLTLTRPDTGEALFAPFSLRLKQGERMILTGPSGCGKSTLLRAISGLWDCGQGEVYLPADGKVALCVPQKPYLPNIPMTGILCYPQEDGYFSKEQLEDALRIVGLEQKIPMLYDQVNEGAYWSSRLSLGEQQKVVFARIFLHKPDILMLDEVTASLDENSEYDLYTKMLEKLPNTTLISITHRKKIIDFHTLHASLGNKTLTVKRIEPKPEPGNNGPAAPNP